MFAIFYTVAGDQPNTNRQIGPFASCPDENSLVMASLAARPDVLLVEVAQLGLGKTIRTVRSVDPALEYVKKEIADLNEECSKLKSDISEKERNLRNAKTKLADLKTPPAPLAPPETSVPPAPTADDLTKASEGPKPPAPESAESDTPPQTGAAQIERQASARACLRGLVSSILGSKTLPKEQIRGIMRDVGISGCTIAEELILKKATQTCGVFGVNCTRLRLGEMFAVAVSIGMIKMEDVQQLLRHDGSGFFS